MTDDFSLADAERVLTELEREIAERIRGMEQSTSAPAMDSSVGRLTYIDAYQQQQVSLHARRKLDVQLAAIRAALKRVEAGTYGACVQCGSAIPLERLEIAPEVALCVRCTERLGR